MMDPRWKRLLLLFGIVAVLFLASVFLSNVFSVVGVNQSAEKIGSFEVGFSKTQLSALGPETGSSFEQKMVYLRNHLTVYETADASQSAIAPGSSIQIHSTVRNSETFWLFTVPKGVVGKNYSVLIDLDDYSDIKFDLPALKESDLV